MITYFKLVAMTLFLFVNIGIVLPYLFSAASTELVMLGFADVILSFPAVYYFIKSFFKGAK